MRGLRALWPWWSSPEREEMRREKSRGRGLAARRGGRGHMGEATWGKLSPVLPVRLLCCLRFSAASVRKRRKGKREEKSRKGRKKRKMRKRNGKKFMLGIFWGEK
jgi:hypothetical protein